MSTLTRTLVATSACVVVIAAMLSGCSVAATDDAAQPTSAPLADVHPLGDGFLGGDPSPTPEATVSPERGSWDGVVPPDGYRVVLIAAGDDAATATMVSAVRQWAADESVELHVLDADHDDEVQEHIESAVALDPDLVVGVGDGVIDVFTVITPQHLDQKFLVIGAELPEPTENVSSVIWPGASFRGTGLGTSGVVDPATFTPERATEAVSVGVAGVLNGLSGIVFALPE